MEILLSDLFRLLKNSYHLCMAWCANMKYGYPSRKIRVIGITGTDGKTTSTHLIYHILKTAGKKVSMISTVYAQVGNKVFDTGLHTTTPGPFLIQKLLSQAVKHNDEYFILETTSHAIDQKRVWGIQYEVGLLTNITHEHLDYHKTYQQYAETKIHLLLTAKNAVINADDRSYEFVKGMLEKRKHTYVSFGITHKADHTRDYAQILDLPIAEFNRSNYLGASTVTSVLGISENTIQKGIKSFYLPEGRLERYITKKGVHIVVDFAHTPHAILMALQSIAHELPKDTKLIHVFGSAGLRDKTKRPLMGASSGTYAHVVILTEEDYRTEDPVEISRAVATGLVKKGFVEKKPEEIVSTNLKQYTVILNRAEAIQKAVALAHKGDYVVITGKGHEKSLCRGTKEYPWSDREFVKKVFCT